MTTKATGQPGDLVMGGVTDARAIELLRAMRDDGGIVDDAEWIAAVDHAIAALSAQPRPEREVEWDSPCGLCDCGMYDAKALAAFDGIVPKCKLLDRQCVGAVHALACQPASAPAVGRDWHEDASHENGDYECACVTCGNSFTGHKRRVVCRACAKPASAPVGDCPDCTNGQQCDSCSRGERAILESSAPVGVEGLHPETADLVRRFAQAIAEKLAAAERKYGWDTHWKSPPWMDQCREQLVALAAKGDPRDVAAYAAFLWHHGERTDPAQQPAACETCGGRGEVGGLTLGGYESHPCPECEEQQPAAVDEAMVERFLAELRNTPGDEVLDSDEKLARHLLTAALDQPQGEE